MTNLLGFVSSVEYSLKPYSSVESKKRISFRIAAMISVLKSSILGSLSFTIQKNHRQMLHSGAPEILHHSIVNSLTLKTLIYLCVCLL